MTTQFRAQYANGVLTPLESLDLTEGCVVTVSVSEEEPAGDIEEALLTGWLKDVDWQSGTAQLHDAGGGQVSLRFDPSQAEQMRRLTGRHVELRGSGRFDDQDEWITVRVEQLRETQAWSKPFDLDTFLNKPEQKRFNPGQLVRIDLTDEQWEAFNRAIREA